MKGQPRPKGAGRRPGSQNRLTRSVKAAFEAAFAELQRDPKTELTAWARKNRGNLREFYKIAARFIPLELNVPPPMPAPDDVTDIEAARNILFVLEEGKQAVLRRQREERPAPALLPPPPPTPVYREVDRRPPRPEEKPAIEGVARKVVHGDRLVPETAGSMAEQGLARKSQFKAITGRRKW